MYRAIFKTVKVIGNRTESAAKLTRYRTGQYYIADTLFVFLVPNNESGKFDDELGAYQSTEQ